MFLFCHFPRFISVCFLIVIILRGNLNLCLQIRAFKTTDIPQSIQFSSVQSLSRVRLFATPWIAAQQPSLSITNSRSSLRLMFIESVIIMAYFTNLKCRFFSFFFFFNFSVKYCHFGFLFKSCLFPKKYMQLSLF